MLVILLNYTCICAYKNTVVSYSNSIFPFEIKTCTGKYLNRRSIGNTSICIEQIYLMIKSGDNN